MPTATTTFRVLAPRIFAGVLFATGLASAAGYTTQRFDVGFSIAKDREVTVKEEIAVTFTVPQHGLIRRVPLRTGSPSGAWREVRYRLENATLDGRPVRVEQSQDGGDWLLRIGDPSHTLLGPVRYRLVYAVSGALTDIPNDRRGARAELLWNALGAHWPTRIDASEIKVVFPSAKPGSLVARILIGSPGSRRGIQLQRGQPPIGRLDLLEGALTSSSLRVATRKALEAGEGITVVLGLPNGTVAAESAPVRSDEAVGDPFPQPYPEPSPYEGALLWLRFNPLGLILPLLILPVLYRWAKEGFPPKPGPLIVRDEPPANLTAMEASCLLHRSTIPRDLIAGLFELAGKGYVQIVRAGPSQKASFEILRSEPGHDLGDAEAVLLSELAKYGAEIVPETLRGRFGHSYVRISSAVFRSLVAKGMARPDQKGTAGCLISIFAVLLVSVLCFAFFGVSAIGGGLLAGVGSIVVVSKISRLSPEGVHARREVEGLREFLFDARLPAADAASRRLLYDRLLPYAVAFGAVRPWTSAFEGAMLSAPEWYVDPYASGFDQGLWLGAFLDDFQDIQDRYYGGFAPTPPASSSGSTTSYNSGSTFTDFSSGLGSGTSSSGFDASSGGFDSGASVDSGGGGGGGDSW